MKIKVRTLKRILREQLLAEDGGGGLGKLIDDMVAQFTSKMQSTFPQAGDAITQEAAALKTQLVATIKASAAKVKTSMGGDSGGEKKPGFKEPPRERFTGHI